MSISVTVPVFPVSAYIGYAMASLTACHCKKILVESEDKVNVIDGVWRCDANTTLRKMTLRTNESNIMKTKTFAF